LSIWETFIKYHVLKINIMKIINLLIKFIKSKESPLILTMIIAGISLIGWLINKTIFASFSLKYIPIAHSSAVIFIVISLIFISIIRFEKLQFANKIVMPVLFLIVIYCSLIFLDFIFNFSWDLENVFINNPASFGDVPIGRMSPITSLLLIFTCIGIWGIRQKKSKFASYIGGSFSLAICIVSSVLFIGYIYKAPLLYGTQIIPVSLPSVICFLLISFTFLRIGEIQFWTFNLIKNNVIYYQLIKSFLPIVILIVVLQGFLTSNLSINYNNPTLTSAFVLLIVITVTIIVVFRVSTLLGNRIVKAEKDLRESEERYKRITNGISDYLYTVKVKDGKAIETIHNEACFAITGYTSKDFNSDPYLWINMVIPEEREIVAGRFLKILEGENLYSIEHRITHKNGNIRWISDTLIPKYDSDANLISYDGTIKDITDRKNVEEALRLRESYLSAIIEDLPGLLWLKDQNGKFLAVNTKFSNSCGLGNPELLIGKTDFDIWPLELARKYVEDDTKVIKSGKPYILKSPF
jgi:PAS domain S-box-containing protein